MNFFRISVVLIIIILLTSAINGCAAVNSEESYEKGLEYAMHGKFNKAENEFEKAQEDNIAARENLNVIKKVIAGKIKSEAAIHFFKGVDYSNKGQVEETFKELNKAIEIEPDFAHAYYERGLAYGRRAEHDRAISDFSRVIELNPGDFAAYNNRGLAYAKGKKQYDKAFADFNKAIDLNPEFAEAYDNRGIAYRIKFNDKEKACADWRRACELRLCDSYRLARENGYCE